LTDKGIDFDTRALFATVKRFGSSTGAVAAIDFELWQAEIEDKEAEGLKALREFLKMKFTNPAQAYQELGKGEGDVLTKAEFALCLEKVGFVTQDPEYVFKCMDKDFSGEISFAEFKTVMRSVGKRQRSLSKSDESSGNKSNGKLRKQPTKDITQGASDDTPGKSKMRKSVSSVGDHSNNGKPVKQRKTPH